MKFNHFHFFRDQWHCCERNQTSSRAKTSECYQRQYKEKSMNPFTINFLPQLLDVFGHNSEISLVFDYMDTDLEVSIIHAF